MLDVLAGVFAGLVGVRSDGLYFILSEALHHLANQLLLTGQMEIHVQVSFNLYVFADAGERRLSAVTGLQNAAQTIKKPADVRKRPAEAPFLCAGGQG